MNLYQFAEKILFGETLEDKLLPLQSKINFDENNYQRTLPDTPGRSSRLAFSDDRVKFPAKNSFQEKSQRAKAIHFFANHELLAIEIMAYILLKFPHDTEKMKRFKMGVLSTLKDEQKHLKLYQMRMNELGIELGDFPLNNYFWSFHEKIKCPDSYLTLMAFTFETANLDFASYYQEVFEEVHDLESASIMKIVFEDEIRHVQFGVQWAKSQGIQDVWKYYVDNLPWPATPNRSKGIQFNRQARQKCGLDPHFIHQAENFSDHYAITNRKQWK